MNKFIAYHILILTGLLALQGCSLMHQVPDALENKLQTAMQQPDAETDAEQQRVSPIKLDYEIKHIFLPGQELSITLNIKPETNTRAAVYSVKVPEGVQLLEPVKIINLGPLKSSEIYRETIRLRPAQEGMFEIRMYLAYMGKDKIPQIKITRIPISVGPFQHS